MAKALVLGGATGLLGQALTRALTARDWEVSTLGRNDGNLLDVDFVQTSIARAQADVVFNTVAFTAVDDAEDHTDEACQLNRTLPDTLARAVKATSQGFLVQFSTDFIFSGSEETPKLEEDTPQPASVYGRTKLEGEKAVLAALPERSCIVRTAWLFGPGRKNFVDTILAACQRRDSINVVHDQIGSPTYTVDLAQWSIALAEKRAVGVWHAVNSGQASWCELACEAVALAGAPCRVVPIDSAEWPQKAKRPSFSVLNNSKLADFLGKKPRPWPQALRDYIFSEYLPTQNKAKAAAR
jgi:dTDP-4-dehydrorhamnose reductase